jgi:hypothetical protein
MAGRTRHAAAANPLNVDIELVSDLEQGPANLGVNAFA